MKSQLEGKNSKGLTYAMVIGIAKNAAPITLPIKEGMKDFQM